MKSELKFGAYVIFHKLTLRHQELPFHRVSAVKTLFNSLTVCLGRLFRPKKPLKIYFEISNTHVRGKLYMNFNVLNFTSEHVSILSRIHIIMVMLSFVFQLHNDINMLPTNDTLFSNSHFFF